MPRLPPSPDLDWIDGAPRAVAFDDIYFSRQGGLQESEAVFLAGCGLPEAWAGRDRYAICELGFGSGLNILAAWRAWKRTRAPHAILHICTVEAFPLARADAARTLGNFPEIADLAAALLECWPVRAYAPQRVWFPEERLALTIDVGEAERVLAGMVGAFDAWFLDGFAPARNPAMWSAKVFQHIGRLSAPGARIATYSVAGDVRRGLETAGCEVARKPGFAHKRERLEAVRTAPSLPSFGLDGGGALYPYAASTPKRVAILGAGIAGAACAHALTRRGVETLVLEAAPQLGAGASGNPAGLVMPRLDRGEGPARELFLAAYLDAVAAYEAAGAFQRCGVEERGDARSEARLDLLADPPLPQDWFCALQNGAALHVRAGLVRPDLALAHMLRDAKLMLDAPVGAIERVGEGWRVRAPDGRALLQADAVVLACGPALTMFDATRVLPVQLSRGQIEWGPLGADPPRYALTNGAYAAPFGAELIFGATFDRTGSADAPIADAASRARNVAALTELAPHLAEAIDLVRLQSRAALRVTTPDRMPIAGLLADADAWLSANAAIAQGGEGEMTAPPPAHDGVYVLGGLGARGLTLAPLLGERIAAEMFGEPQALSGKTLAAMHPARFMHRALKRSG